jgi:hypothetical protein
MLSPRFPRSFAKWMIGLSAGAVAAACLVACGGGGTTTASNGSGVGSGGTGSFTTGSVSGFGSVIVNDIRYDDTGVLLSSQDGDNVSALKLGMVIDVEGGSTSQVTKSSGEVQTVAKASSIKVGFELQGPVTSGSVNTTDGTFRSLGQTVKVTVDTFFDQDNGLSGVGATPACLYVRVYGFPKTEGGYTASRVECLSAQPSTYRVRGPVTQISGSTVSINDGSTSGQSAAQYMLGNGVPAPNVGQIVRAVLSVSGPSWTIVSFNGESRPLSQTRDARVEGVVSDYSAATGTLHVNGVPVKVSSSTTLDLIRPSLAAGMRVEVRGPLVNGVLNATWIEEEDDQYVYSGGGGGGSGSPPSGGGLREIELHGNVDTLSPGTQCFYTRGVKVYFLTSGTNRTKFPSGKSASDLRDGLAVEVKGVRSNSGGGAIVATEIKFSND